jgi:GT2 family glycosyltransferase
MKMTETSVIVLTWNQMDLTIRCLESLLKQSYKDYEVILVDNGSDDGTPDAVKKKFGEKVKVVALPENRGFCGGNNAGVRECSKESKYVMLLNNDTIVPENLLSETVKSIKSRRNIGAVTVPVYTKGMEKAAKESLEKRVSHTSNIFLDCITVFIDKEVKNNNFVFFPCGTCFLYRKEIVELPFDEDYFIYAEENYFGALIRLMGYDVVFCRTTSIFHENSVVKKRSSRKLKRHFAYLGRRNRLLNQFLFFEGMTLLKISPLILFYHIMESAWDAKNILARLKAYYYIIANIGKIREKRRRIRDMRKLRDKKFLRFISCKVMSEGAFGNFALKKIVKAINALFYGYCVLLGIKTIERSPNLRKRLGITKIS